MIFLGLLTFWGVKMITVAEFHDRLGVIIAPILEKLDELGFKNVSVAIEGEADKMRVEVDCTQEEWDKAVEYDRQFLSHYAWEYCPHCSVKYNKLFHPESYTHNTDL